MSIWNVINLAGGLAMFIFGMNLMSDGLKLVAGSYLKKILEKLTKNRIIAMMVGAGLTALIQSSNAMCVMVVGFVNAGMMQLERSVGILMGAKIGTTITGQLIAFNISEIAPVIAFVGVAITMFSKKPKVKKCRTDYCQPWCIVHWTWYDERSNEAVSRRGLVPEFAAKVF